MMAPEFPIRIISDDGECEEFESPEALISAIDSIDSVSPNPRVWVRDARDRTVLIRMRGGAVEVLELAPPSHA